MYSQRDPRWSNVRLGTSTSTIGSDGCLVCCVADMLKSCNYHLDPARLNRWLVNHGGYSQGNRFVFNSVKDLGAQMVFLGDWSKCLANVTKMCELFLDGSHVIVEVNFYPWGKFVSHWVSVVDTGEDFEILDPWLSTGYANDPISLLATYAKPNQNLGHAIYRAVAYQVDEFLF